MPLEPDLIDWPYERPKPMGDTQIAQGLNMTFNYNFQPPFALDSDVRQINTATAAGVFVIVGSIYTSSDGLSWTTRAGAPSGILTGCANSGSIYCVCGVKIWSSPDLDTYTQRTSGLEGIILNDIKYASSLFVAVGGDIHMYILTSSDGISWTSYNLDMLPGNRLSRVCNDGSGTWVAVGVSNTIVRSTDGITWTSIPNGASVVNLTGIAFGNSVFVATASDGNVFTSSNGTSWTERTTGAADQLLDVVFGGSLFVAVGGSGQIYTSSNGISWTARTSPSIQTWTGVAYSGSQFMIVGNPSGNPYIPTAYSSDAITWTGGSNVGSGGEGNVAVVFV